MNDLNNHIQISQSGSEISLTDILCFLKNAWKLISIAALTGLVLSIVYLAITPKQYEAIAQIAMAQIGAINNSNMNPLGINIEEPSLLIARMSSPTSFTPQVIEACGLREQANAALQLSKAIKLTTPKGVSNLVELKTFGPSVQIAEQCSFAIFELIKTTQSQILAPYIAEAKVKLDDDIERLAKARDMVAKADRTGSVMGAAYLSTRDEIRFLLDEITALKNVVISNQNRATRLISPIYVGNMPIAPKKRIVLASGLFFGLFLGLSIAIGSMVMGKLKNQADGAW